MHLQPEATSTFESTDSESNSSSSQDLPNSQVVGSQGVSIQRGASQLNAGAIAILKQFFANLRAGDKRLLLGHEIATELKQYLDSMKNVSPAERKSIEKFLRGCPEIVLDGDGTYIVQRPAMGVKRVIRLYPASETLEEVSRGEYLEMKDRLVQGYEEAAKPGLVIDFAPFFRDLPRVSDPANMGAGVLLLNQRLSAQSHKNPERFRGQLLRFLQEKEINGRSILLSDDPQAVAALDSNLESLLSALEDLPAETPYADVAHSMRVFDFEAGWGSDVRRIRENLTLLQQVLESADPTSFAKLLHRLPMVRTVLMVSPHGWFAQDGVLGRPDTGGQVTYVLDQARALESRINQQLVACGLEKSARVAVLTRLIPDADGTTCNIAREAIHGSEDSWIIRVPFRDASGNELPNWVSRFQIWPYVEQFATDSQAPVVNELLGQPDLIVGHYTDGNLVAHLLAEQFGVTHCACVHALEKTKYLLSDAHWADLEEQYRFSMHFTADLVSYNSADFIVSSSFREIGGTQDEMGMIESYDLFSLPGLYRVQSGFNPRLARHNIVPPGASEEFFFPNTSTDRRPPQLTSSLAERFLAAEPYGNAIGTLADPSLPPVFAMARIDKIKNLSGLVEIFAKSDDLRTRSNLLLVTSINTLDEAEDPEEIEEIQKITALLEEYQLHDQVRWCAARLDKTETGEIYRLVADHRGVFAQPALMETFGLTVIEAMACGLPVVGTCFGGPSEIIEAGKCGEVANPNEIEEFGAALARVLFEPNVWGEYTTAGITRVETAYTWRLHAEKLLGMANLYSYWNHSDEMNRPALDRYIHTLYHTVFRPRAEAM